MNISNYRGYIIPAIFALGIFGLAWQRGNVSITRIPRPFEILFSLLFVLVVFEIAVSKKGKSLMRSFRPTLFFFGAVLGALYLFIVVGGASSFQAWAALHTTEVGLGYVSIAFAMLVFFLSAYIAAKSRESVYWGLSALAVSPLLFFAAFVPRWKSSFIDNTRLVGTYNDPNITANFIAVGLLLSIVFYLYSTSRFRWAGGLYIFLSMPLFLWANSRGAFFSVAVVLVLLSVHYIFREFSWKKAGDVFFLFAIVVFSTYGALLVLPDDSRAYTYQRSIAPVFDNEGLRESLTEDWISGENSEIRLAMLEKISKESFSRSRGKLWDSAVRKAAGSPLGFGPAYHKWDPFEPGKGVHNLWLQIPLTAGWGGFLLWLVFLGAIFRRTFQIMQSGSFIGIALPTLLVFLLVNGIFIDIFTLRWLWLIMGMTVGYAFLTYERTQGIDHTPSL